MFIEETQNDQVPRCAIHFCEARTIRFLDSRFDIDASRQKKSKRSTISEAFSASDSRGSHVYFVTFGYQVIQPESVHVTRKGRDVNGGINGGGNAMLIGRPWHADRWCLQGID